MRWKLCWLIESILLYWVVIPKLLPQFQPLRSLAVVFWCRCLKKVSMGEDGWGGGGHRMTNDEETETEKTKYQNHISDVVYIVPDFEVLHLLFNNLLITTPDPPPPPVYGGGGMWSNTSFYHFINSSRPSPQTGQSRTWSKCSGLWVSWTDQDRVNYPDWEDRGVTDVFGFIN